MKQPKPKIDLNELVKRARKIVAAKGKPSKVKESYWLSAERMIGSYPEPTERSGKWLVFVKTSDVDKVWAKIKEATEDGKLGGAAKVSTGKQNPNAVDMDKKVICVYTYDWADGGDVRRVRAELRKLGITEKIPYKSDSDTLSGKYRVSGHARISKYYE